MPDRNDGQAIDDGPQLSRRRGYWIALLPAELRREGVEVAQFEYNLMRSREAAERGDHGPVSQEERQTAANSLVQFRVNASVWLDEHAEA